jgi:hypothetical protein
MRDEVGLVEAAVDEVLPMQVKVTRQWDFAEFRAAAEAVWELKWICRRDEDASQGMATA